jgi:lysophospholipase L1-like esterase
MKLRRIAAFCAISALVFLLGRRLVHADASMAFLGDSIIHGWSYPSANFGVNGETTGQMLGREPAILSSRQYRTIIILGGGNDILRHIPSGQTIRNLDQLGRAAVQEGVRPVLCEITPIFHNSSDLADRSNYMPQVIELNRQIARLAAVRGWLLVDYFSILEDRPYCMSDGEHLKRRAYLLMECALLRRLY